MIDLYSFQPYPVVERAFAKHGEYTPSAAMARHQSILDDGDTSWWDAVQPAYQWIIGEMEAAGLPRPSADATPLWAWAQWIDDKGNVCHHPNLKSEDFTDSYEDCDLLHLRVEREQCLFTCFDAFHMVINNWPAPPLEAKDWDDATYDRWLDEHWEDTAEQRRQQWHDNVIVPYDQMPREWVQATLWTIRPENVVEVEQIANHP